jgi:serine/threonine protein kinase
MNCERSKCKKSMLTPHPCKNCLKKFCAKACMIDHFFEAHINEKNNQLQTEFIPKRKSGTSSKFITPGKYLGEFIPTSDFNFSNFEKVKSGSNCSRYNLGSGGFGEVYLGKHKKKGNYVAIKEMNKKKIIDSGHKLDIIYKEITFNGRLQHENIIKMHSFYEDNSNIYLIMEYADSGNLFTAIRKNGGFSEVEAFSYFVQVCAGVNFIHECNLIHRDLKPENILLNKNNQIKICDFGWCIELNVGTRNTFCGTYEYMAPEIIREKPYDHSIDVWSLGILLYELLHGYSPFKAQTNNNDCYEVFDKIIKFDLKFEKELTDDCKDLIISIYS